MFYQVVESIALPNPAPIEGAGRVTHEAFLREVSESPVLAFDTETTGLMPYHGDTVFAITVANEHNAFYFDVTDGKFPEPLAKLFEDEKRTWYMHNAKFDLHAIYCTFEQLPPKGVVHDTAIGARLEFNDHISYGLDACVQRLGAGLVKDDAVMDYIREHKLWDWETVPGKKVRRKKMFFDRVPFEIMFKYACQDAYATWHLGVHQEAAIESIDGMLPEGTPALKSVLDTERELVKVVQDMESYGVAVDEEFCRIAMEYHQALIETAAQEFEVVTGRAYKASPKLFEEVFANEREKWSFTEKGNPSFESDTLQRFSNPAAKHILQIRDSKSRMDFFATFLYQADDKGIVHPSFNAGGTATGRFSSSEPNFQNLTNDEENPNELYPVRRAIIPPNSDYCIVSMDYKQQEYALMLDYAGEMDLIEEVKNGKDVHEATAQLMGTTRKYAKTLNFMLLYGGGVAKLAAALGITVEEAKRLRALYFAKLPRVERFIKQVMSVTETRGYVYNWAGRRYFCTSPEFSYRFPNRVIQGGGADIMKRAMVRIGKEVLPGTRSTMALTVHDELVFYIHRADVGIVPKLKAIMEEVYPCKHLPMRVDVSHSWKSLADLEEGAPEAPANVQVLPKEDFGAARRLLSDPYGNPHQRPRHSLGRPSDPASPGPAPGVPAWVGAIKKLKEYAEASEDCRVQVKKIDQALVGVPEELQKRFVEYAMEQIAGHLDRQDAYTVSIFIPPATSFKPNERILPQQYYTRLVIDLRPFRAANKVKHAWDAMQVAVAEHQEYIRKQMQRRFFEGRW